VELVDKRNIVKAHPLQQTPNLMWMTSIQLLKDRSGLRDAILDDLLDNGLCVKQVRKRL